MEGLMVTPVKLYKSRVTGPWDCPTLLIGQHAKDYCFGAWYGLPSQGDFGKTGLDGDTEEARCLE